MVKAKFPFQEEATLTQIIESASLLNRVKLFFGVSLQTIGIVFLTRLLIDVGTRMSYPFIPQFSAGLGLTIVGFSWLIFVRAMVGVVGPIFGVWSDRSGRRKMMVLGLLCQAIGGMGVAFAWQWWATLPMILIGLGSAAFLPVQQAYISDQVVYQKRGRALAAVEFSWAAAAIFVLPIIGWMIDAFGWRVPFLALSLFSLIGAAIVGWYLPPTTVRHTQSLSWSETRAVFLKKNILASMGVACLIFVAASSFLTVWGIWLTADFSFNAATLGLVATGIGIAELVGSGLASLFIDRIGKKRGSSLGLLLLLVAFVLLPLTQSRLFIIIAALITMGTLFEFTIVSLIPLYSEQVPRARGTVLALGFLGAGVGSAIGAPITTTLWEQHGLWAVCAMDITCLLAALGLIRKFLHEHTAFAMSSHSYS